MHDHAQTTLILLTKAARRISYQENIGTIFCHLKLFLKSGSCISRCCIKRWWCYSSVSQVGVHWPLGVHGDVLKAVLASRSRESKSWESRFFLGVGVEKLCLPESRVGVEKVCSTLNSDSQSFAGMEGFLCMNKLPKYTVGLSKSRSASVLQISWDELAFLTSKCSKQSST